ncbi:MAG: type IV pilus secretin PilQ [Pseudomonadales bacterium]|nr:type IV pilus secretin PilQ [Pseudomonadales bacterium]NRA16032.1 type IV pilus secretin PilQ [Oceanospirillaceae bacterium]
MLRAIIILSKKVAMLGRCSRACLMLLLAMMLSNHALAADILLLKFAVKQVAPGQLELKMQFDAPPPIPTAFVLKSPDRVLIDLWGVENGTGEKTFPINQQSLRSLELVQVKGRLRVVANLNRLTNYSTYAQGNALFIQLDENEVIADREDSVANSQTTATVPIPAEVAVVKKMPTITGDPLPERTRVQGIDFERAENGIGRVKIKLSNDRAGIEVFEEGHNVLINLTGAVLSDQLNKRLDVQDFSTPVMFIDAFSQGQNSGILIKPDAKPYKFKSYQVGRELIVDIWPKKRATASAARAEKSAKQRFTGEKIDLNFQNVSIRSVLQIIAEVAQKNLVVDDSVSGNITLRLLNVPWDQALDLVLKTRGLDKRLVGNVLLIAPAAKLAERERIELEGIKQIEDLSPIETEFIQINYRKSSEMKARLEEASLITERGFVLADDATNVLMVRETAKQLEVIANTLEKFDVAVAQIMIEAKLVTASNDISEDLGVRWGVGYNDGRYVVGGGGSGTIGLPGDTGAITSPLTIDLGVSAQSAIRLGYISGNGLQLSTEISALHTTGKAEIISQPKIITTNGKPAKIESGQELPYVVVQDGTPTIAFKNVVLSLEVVPQITPGDQISLELKLTQDSIGAVLPNGEVSINKNFLETSVIVKDGDTIVLGGVYKNETTNSISKTPFLGDLPLIGALFRKTQKKELKNELLIFITPKLIRKTLSAN